MSTQPPDPLESAAGAFIKYTVERVEKMLARTLDVLEVRRITSSGDERFEQIVQLMQMRLPREECYTDGDLQKLVDRRRSIDRSIVQLWLLAAVRRNRLSLWSGKWVEGFLCSIHVPRSRLALLSYLVARRPAAFEQGAETAAEEGPLAPRSVPLVLLSRLKAELTGGGNECDGVVMEVEDPRTVRREYSSGKERRMAFGHRLARLKVFAQAAEMLGAPLYVLPGVAHVQPWIQEGPAEAARQGLLLLYAPLDGRRLEGTMPRKTAESILEFLFEGCYAGACEALESSAEIRNGIRAVHAEVSRSLTERTEVRHAAGFIRELLDRKQQLS